MHSAEASESPLKKILSQAAHGLRRFPVPNPIPPAFAPARANPGAFGPLRLPSSFGCYGNPAAMAVSLSQAPPSRVFVELVPWADRDRENHPVASRETVSGTRYPLPPTQAPTREVHVSGTAEVSAGPDRALVVVRVSSTKEAAGEAKRSVGRRLDYIRQSLQQQGLQVRAAASRARGGGAWRGRAAENVAVTTDFRRVENAYHMEAEVCVTFTEFGKMQNICNFLVEKLDSSVVISSAQFYHTPGAIENLRRQACVVAVENARRKAQEVCNLVGQTLGKPLLIKEEETKEWEGQIDNHQSPRLSGSLTVQQKMKNATIHAASKVFITFEVKGKEKKKKHL
ncbi:interleukin-1 receptor-associated kinase 1-binding protein 1 [Ctenodactylus gundi]